jgi:FkbM family methyltransferase
LCECEKCGCGSGKRDIYIDKPVSDKRELLTYYAFNEPALNGFSKKLKDERIIATSPYRVIFEKKIETSTLSEILDEYLPENQDIDFLSIDVEGLDFLVLKSINFNKYKPKVILVEILGSTLEDLIDNEISIYLKNFQYIIHSKSINSTIFISNTFYNSLI